MKREGSLRTSPSCRSYYVAVRRGECDEGWPAAREGQEIPLPSPASRNHRVFDADQCADLQNTIISLGRTEGGSLRLSVRTPPMRVFTGVARHLGGRRQSRWLRTADGFA